MFESSLKTKFSDPGRGVYFIGTTPPKRTVAMSEMQTIATKLVKRLENIEYDGLVVYDIQDETSRNPEPRPFPFCRTHDSREYSALLRTTSGLPVITYKSAAEENRLEFDQWLDKAWSPNGVRDLVLVGSPATHQGSNFPLPAAYDALQQHPLDFHLGGVAIAERHASKANEHLRLIEKTRQGCDYFITQAVYNPEATIQLCKDYAAECRRQNLQPKRLILTFSPCGSEKTLDFMQWLGISVPGATRNRILGATNPLAESIRVCRNNLQQIIDACAELGIPLGLNIESLTNRKEEIDGTIRLFKLLKATLELNLAEQHLQDFDTPPLANIA